MINKNQFAKIIVLLSQRLNKLCVVTASAFLILMLFFVILQVITRYAFDAPPQWTEEAARYCMIWMGLLGSTASFHKKEDPILFQPSEDLIQKWDYKIRLIEFIAVMIFILPLLYFGPSFIMRHSGRLSESLEINMAFIVAIIPLYAGIIVLHAIARLFSLPHRTTS